MHKKMDTFFIFMIEHTAELETTNFSDAQT